jgi:DNA-binding response OmpR family regulator
METTKNHRILIIEDDPRMTDILRRGLWEGGHTVLTACTADEGEALIATHEFDAIVLDVGLPDRSGTTVAEHLRDRKPRPAIVMLTALSEVDCIVAGLNAGADDYVTKPFSFPELIARITAASRRSQLNRAGEVHFTAYKLDLHQHRLFHSGEEVNITRSEYLLLRELAIRRGEIISRRQLMATIWKTDQVSEGALHMLVSSLREKIDPDKSGLIVTSRGLGYMMPHLRTDH